MASVYKSISKSAPKPPPPPAPEVKQKNKQRVLILTSRGVTHRHRHLLNDLASMLPHGRKDAKLDTKSQLRHLNEIADLYNCNNVLFFEARKRQDLYVWLSKAPNGPCVKMHMQNLHTMQELHFTGNALKGSRPILSFGAAFDASPAMRVIKELLSHTFGVPRGARKSKPFVDRVLAFALADGKVWFRNYQICEGGEEVEMSLVEIGPRFVMTPIVILEGSFGGPVVFENREFVSPNAVRAGVKVGKAARHIGRVEERGRREVKLRDLGVGGGVGKRVKGGDELDEGVLFA